VSSRCSLADHNSLRLPTAADLTQAFLRDLSNVLDTQRDDTPWLSVFFFAATSSTSTWTTDRDVTLRAVLNVGGTASSILNLDGATFTSVFATAGHAKKNIIWIGGTSQEVFYPLIWAISGGTKLYFNNSSASNGGILLYYT